MSQQKPIARAVTGEAVQPIYHTVADDFRGPHGDSEDPRFALRADFVENVKGIPAVRSWYSCPHCGMIGPRRKPLMQHMGMVADKLFTCPVLRAEVAARRGGQ